MFEPIKKAGVLWLSLSFLVAYPTWGVQFPEKVNLSAAQLVNNGKMNLKLENSILNMTITPNNSEVEIQLPLTQALDSHSKNRLLLTMRSHTTFKDSLRLSQIILVGEDDQRATYKSKFGISFYWCMRTALFFEFENPIPSKITAVILRFAISREVGRSFSAYIKNLELLNDADIAARVIPPEGSAPAKLAPIESKLKSEDQRWTSIDPGGGGWYRCIAISPHDGTCFLGSDVGGIYVSRNKCKSWELCSNLHNRYIQGFAFHPKDPNLVIAVTQGGPIRSTDNGYTWQTVRQGLPQCQTWGMSAPMTGIAFHPTKDNLVLAGGGFDYSGYSGSIRKKDRWGAKWTRGVIYRSLDRGKSWEICQLPDSGKMNNYSVNSFLFSPINPDEVYAVTNGGGLVFSSDAGKTWLKYGQDLSKYVLGFIASNPIFPDTWLLTYSGGVSGSGGVLRSRDRGKTWQEINNGLPKKISAWRLIADVKDPNTFYVGWFRNGGIYVTHNQGDTWKKLAVYDQLTPKPYLFCDGSATGLAQDPRNPSRLTFCNAMNVYQTFDTGQTWKLVSSELVKAATPEHPACWRGRNCPVLCSGGPKKMAINPSNPQELYFTYMDVNTWKSMDGGQTFFRLTNGTNNGFGATGALVLDPTDSRIVYMTKGRNYSNQRFYKSVDSGASFYLLGHEGNGLPPGAIYDLLIDPSSPIEKRVIYALISNKSSSQLLGVDPKQSFRGGVYRSDDGGFTWQAKNFGLPEEHRRFAQMAMDPRNPKRLFVVCSNIRPAGYIARSDDGGESWTILKKNIEPQCIVIDPFDSNKIYVGNRNYSNNDYPNAFYRSLDGGNTWESLNQDAFPSHFMKDMPLDNGQRTRVGCLAADPTTPGRIYAGCSGYNYDINNNGGLFVSDDWGKTWQRFSAVGMGGYGIGSLVVDPTDPSRLYASGGGNGFFRYGPSPCDSRNPNQEVLHIQNDSNKTIALKKVGN